LECGRTTMNRTTGIEQLGTTKAGPLSIVGASSWDLGTSRKILPKIGYFETWLTRNFRCRLRLPT